MLLCFSPVPLQPGHSIRVRGICATPRLVCCWRLSYVASQMDMPVRAIASPTMQSNDIFPHF